MNEADYRMLLGGYVSNILDHDERTAVDAHLVGCVECQQELATLSDTSARLAHLARWRNPLAEGDENLPDVAQLEAEGARLENDLVLARTLQVVRSERSRSGRRRIVAIAAAVAVLLVGGGVTGALIEGQSSSPSVSSAAVPGGRTFTAHDAATGVGMTVTVIPQQIGFSRLQARLTYEPANAHCQLIAVGRNGQREVASSWAVGPDGSGAAGTQVTGSVAIPAADIQRLEVRTLGGRHIVAVNTG